MWVGCWSVGLVPNFHGEYRRFWWRPVWAVVHSRNVSWTETSLGATRRNASLTVSSGLPIILVFHNGHLGHCRVAHFGLQDVGGIPKKRILALFWPCQAYRSLWSVQSPSATCMISQVTLPCSWSWSNGPMTVDGWCTTVSIDHDCAHDLEDVREDAPSWMGPFANNCQVHKDCEQRPEATLVVITLHTHGACFFLASAMMRWLSSFFFTESQPRRVDLNVQSTRANDPRMQSQLLSLSLFIICSSKVFLQCGYSGMFWSSVAIAGATKCWELSSVCSIFVCCRWRREFLSTSQH